MALPTEVVHLVVQLNVNPNLDGSNPDIAGTRRKFWENKKSVILALPAEVVQLVEQLTDNPKLESLKPAAVDTAKKLL